MVSTTTLVATTCLVCLSFVFIDVVSGGACPYIPHCDDCTYNPDTKRATCFRCDQFYAHRIVNTFSRCISCGENNSGCANCTDFTKCDKCRNRSRDGPDLNGKATCSPCAPNCRNCARSGSGKCDQCARGARKVGDQCERCNIANCDYCDSSSGVCSTCASGFYLKENECLPCVENCRMCRDSERCTFCRDFFFVETDSGLCKPCTDNCRSCKDFDTCENCKLGYYKDSNSKCQQCPDGCTACTSPDDCQFCKTGRPVNGACTCAPNCKSCANSGNSKCDQCEDGYVQDKSKRCRKACPENCKECTDSKECQECENQFTLVDGQCINLN